MERKPESGDTFSLIDFSSPVSKRVLHMPLIPMPTTDIQIPVLPTNTDPFDILVKQTTSSEAFENDPFECATKTKDSNDEGKKYDEAMNNCDIKGDKRTSEALEKDPLECSARTKHSNDTEKEHWYTRSIQNGHFQGDVQIISSCSVENDPFECPAKTCITRNVTKVKIQEEPLVEIKEQSCDNLLPVKPEKKIELEIATANNEFENKSGELRRCGEDILSQVSGDFSSEEGIKATIAKRVNTCIQKVLSNSLVNTKSNKKNSGLKMNRKSSSFTTCSVRTKPFDKENKSCSGPASLDNSFFKSPESSIGSCDLSLFSFMSGEDLQNESIIQTSQNDDIFEEANKLARTFSKLAGSFTKNAVEAENDDNLLTCKPQWLYADSSEDEDEKLKKDPALNIRVSLTNSMSQPDPEALSEYKTRLRRSLSNIQKSDIQIENSFKRSLSIGSKPVIAPVVPTTVSTSVPIILEKHDDNPLKLKKKPAGEVKKGPMRAVMPVQNMAKESLTSGGQLTRVRATSPVRKLSSSHLMISPIKDASHLNMRPVASSTPNKCSVAAPHNVMLQRHSLDSTAENHKSRNPVVESGPRQRSSSASSCIPTKVPLSVRSLGPKSVSNLTRSSIKPEINAHQDKSLEKKLTKQQFNPKALNEVKSKVARTSRMKSTVNAISNMVTGKNKKSALRDKENRFPV